MPRDFLPPLFHNPNPSGLDPLYSYFRTWSRICGYIHVCNCYRRVNNVLSTFLRFFLQFKETVSQNFRPCFFHDSNTIVPKIHGLNQFYVEVQVF